MIMIIYYQYYIVFYISLTIFFFLVSIEWFYLYQLLSNFIYLNCMREKFQNFKVKYALAHYKIIKHNKN